MRRGNQLGEGAKPTLDAQHLQKLVKDASLGTAKSFAAEYMAILPRLVEGIARAVGGQDGELALEASLHVKAKSWLVGALRMNQLCTELELALALGDWTTATAVARDIQLHLPRLQKALQAGPDLGLRTRRPRAFETVMAS